MADFESRHVSAGRMEPWFRRSFPQQFDRVVAKFVVIGVLFAGLGAAGGFVFDKALGN